MDHIADTEASALHRGNRGGGGGSGELLWCEGSREQTEGGGMEVAWRSRVNTVHCLLRMGSPGVSAAAAALRVPRNPKSAHQLIQKTWDGILSLSVRVHLCVSCCVIAPQPKR